MTSITRLRFLNMLYNLKEIAKCTETGVIAPNQTANILELIKDGFAKLEYMYLLKTKKAFTRILGKDSLITDYTETTLDYARFSLYVLLLGYLDSHIHNDELLYDKLCQENDDHYILVAQRISYANDLRKCIMKDYAYELDDENSIYLRILSEPKKVLSGIGSNLEGVDEEELFNISGFYQNYLEGYKMHDNTNIQELISAYQSRKKAYVKYRTKCAQDLESVGALLIKENKPLL